MNFVSASGDPIPNLGEQVLPLLTEEETLRTMKLVQRFPRHQDSWISEAWTYSCLRQ